MPEIYPHTATLADIPAQFRGVSWARWEALQWAAWREKAARSPFDRAAWEAAHPVQTSRDRYGWRGLLGTSYLGGAK